MFPPPVGGYESRKCYRRVRKYLGGKIIDIGCGREKITPEAIGVDFPNERLSASDIWIDLSTPKNLRIFRPEYFDVVFSSHCLEDMVDVVGSLKEWWRILKTGGYMILYLPHAEYSPHVGSIGVNPWHKNDFIPENIINIMNEFACYELVSNTSHNELDEYAFELVLRKQYREV